jgi:hypothetical protein
MQKRLRGLTKRQRRMVLWINVLLVAGFGVWHFGVATLFVLETRYVAWKAPVVKTAPTELADVSISMASGQKLTYGGYQFEVPWDVDAEKTKQIKETSVVIVFQSGNALWFSRMPAKEFVDHFLAGSKTDADSLREFYGDEALRSDYSLTNLILETTPQRIGLFSNRRQAAGGAMLLLTKAIMMPPGGETGIFRVRTGDFRGFQYGDPRRRPKSIDVEIFSDSGGLAFLFGQREKGSVPAITQAEINRVIQSVRKAPEQDLSASR